MRSIDVRPMRPLQRVFVGGTYAVLLAGPVLAGVVAIGFMPLFSRAIEAVNSADQIRQRYERAEAEAAKRSIPELVDGIVAHELRSDADSMEKPALAAPADEATVVAAQTRLGVTLADDLVAFYRAVDGAPLLGLHPLAGITSVARSHGLDMARYADQGRIDVFTNDSRLTAEAPPREIRLQLHELEHFLVLANDADWDAVLLYDAGEPPLNAGLRIYSLQFDGYNEALPSFASWLRVRWVQSLLNADLPVPADATYQTQP